MSSFSLFPSILTILFTPHEFSGVRNALYSAKIPIYFLQICKQSLENLFLSQGYRFCSPGIFPLTAILILQLFSSLISVRVDKNLLFCINYFIKVILSIEMVKLFYQKFEFTLIQTLCFVDLTLESRGK